MVRIKGDFLLDLDVVHPFQNRQPMPHAHDGHLFQLFMLQRHQGFTDNLVFYPNSGLVLAGVAVSLVGSQTKKLVTILMQTQARNIISTLAGRPLRNQVQWRHFVRIMMAEGGSWFGGGGIGIGGRGIIIGVQMRRGQHTSFILIVGVGVGVVCCGECHCLGRSGLRS